MELFRQQVVARQQHRLQGEVVVLPRLPHYFLCLALLSWLALVLVFLTQANYSRKETVRGWLEPTAGLVQVYAQSEGKLAQLLVAEGEQVQQNQALAVINGDRILADGQHLEQLLLEEYQAQKQVLQAQLQRAARLSESAAAELAQRLRSGQLELTSLGGQIHTLEQQAALLDRRGQRYSRLQAAGHVTDSELELLREQQLTLQHKMQQVSLQRMRQQASVEHFVIQQQQQPITSANAADTLRLSLSDLSQQIARLRGNRAYVIRAAISGTVSDIRVKQGQRAQLNQPLLTLLPENPVLIARLLVPVRAAGFLMAGQSLSLRYDAFPHQKFGSSAAAIDSVAATSSLPGNNYQLPFTIAEPVYKVQARLESSAVSAYGQSFPLKAGMTLWADVQLEQRSLLQWLLEPLFSLRGRLQ
jgi:membrane fusion protein